MQAKSDAINSLAAAAGREHAPPLLGAAIDAALGPVCLGANLAWYRQYAAPRAVKKLLQLRDSDLVSLEVSRCGARVSTRAPQKCCRQVTSAAGRPWLHNCEGRKESVHHVYIFLHLHQVQDTCHDIHASDSKSATQVPILFINIVTEFLNRR